MVYVQLEGKYGNDELQFDQKPPKPYLPMNIKGKLSVLDLHPEEVARQITLIDHQLFRYARRKSIGFVTQTFTCFLRLLKPNQVN